MKLMTVIENKGKDKEDSRAENAEDAEKKDRRKWKINLKK